MRSIVLPPFYSPIPHVGASVDSTRRLPVRVHQRDLSPQSGETLAGPSIGNEIPVCEPGEIENLRGTVVPNWIRLGNYPQVVRFGVSRARKSPAGSGCRRGRFANYLPLNLIC